MKPRIRNECPAERFGTSLRRVIEIRAGDRLALATNQRHSSTLRPAGSPRLASTLTPSRQRRDARHGRAGAQHCAGEGPHRAAGLFAAPARNHAALSARRRALSQVSRSAGGGGADYRAMSSDLRILLTDIDGFRGVERFESSSEPGRFVAIGSFDDEDAVTRWRNDPLHRRAQRLGRRDVGRA